MTKNPGPRKGKPVPIESKHYDDHPALNVPLRELRVSKYANAKRPKARREKREPIGAHKN
jgi:hypothetical protein